MSVEIKGMDALQRELERRLGTNAMNSILDEALQSGAKAFMYYLKRELAAFSGVPGTTGATLNEVTFTEPYDLLGTRTITIHWKGPSNRYRIIHLNEFGTIKNPKPKGKGAIARALLNAENAYREAVKKAIERRLRNGGIGKNL